MIEAVGKAGQIQFDGQYVTITRKGFLARSIVGKGEKRLHIAQISGVQWKPAGPLINGFIQFTLPGGIERHDAVAVPACLRRLPRKAVGPVESDGV